MENNNVKKPRGRPRFLTDDERRERKSNYMLNKAWFCEICCNNKNYTLAGKSCHLRTSKHVNNYIKTIHEM